MTLGGGCFSKFSFLFTFVHSRMTTPIKWKPKRRRRKEINAMQRSQFSKKRRVSERKTIKSQEKKAER